ncbi:TetR/AcrR family transcriptional regulator [Actinoplanes teichomyceticus]|uniref:TetR family transcriptional regulator n=1 Tax=Actinoplanes teichomyceticus TaxID=1867 RepID=A0A561VCK4_ACTTI|nr:TetR/AcrR family transcriptional regulator [Actinoplanes teichomyceticus]TWG09338.1 TetR family transcriptional regulator [Actinoplanes teichomyceticus]GIF16638.1 TetR family transcriptional regulator [Actinoplanes teichomyceticus]
MDGTRRVEHTRQRIIETAERLFAEHGVFATSNRQISEAADQGNTAAVHYHFGTKAGLVRAIVRRHSEAMDARRAGLIARCAGSTDLRDWVACVVLPFTEHLTSLGTPSWYARFAAQVITEPALRELAAAEIGEESLLGTVTAALHRCLPDLPAAVRSERDDMVRTLIVHFCAQRERTAAPDWAATASGLIDAIEGVYRAPVSPV